MRTHGDPEPRAIDPPKPIEDLVGEALIAAGRFRSPLKDSCRHRPRADSR